jgi:hypothetical protein
MQVIHRVLDASERHSVSDIARSSYHEDISQALVENHLWTNSTVGTREDDRFRRLSGNQFMAQGNQVARLGLASDESAIAGRQTVPDFSRGRRSVTGSMR